MDVVNTPATAPEPQAPPTVQSAVHAAVAGTPADYRAARRAERAGKPLPDVPIPEPVADPDHPDAATPAAAAGTEPPKLSRREREQHEANERTRKAVEAAHADMLAENARLKAELAKAKPAAPVAAKPAAAAPKPDANDATTYPDGVYDPKFIEDLADWKFAEHTKAAAAEQSQQIARTERVTSLKARNDKYAATIKTALDADPQALESLSDNVKALEPFEGFNDKGELVTVTNPTGYHAVAEMIMRSETPLALAQHFSKHEAELHRIAQLAPADLYFELGRVSERLTGGAKPSVSKPKVISSAPPVTEQLRSRATEPVDPMAAAIKNNDTRAYRQLRREQRIAQRAH